MINYFVLTSERFERHLNDLNGSICVNRLLFHACNQYNQNIMLITTEQHLNDFEFN